MTLNYQKIAKENWAETFMGSIVMKKNIIDFIGLTQDFSVNDEAEESIISFEAYLTGLSVSCSKEKQLLQDISNLKLFILWTNDIKNNSAISKVRQTRTITKRGKKIRIKNFSYLTFGIGRIDSLKYIPDVNENLVKFKIDFRPKKLEQISTGNINKFVEEKLN